MLTKWDVALKPGRGKEAAKLPLWKTPLVWAAAGGVSLVTVAAVVVLILMLKDSSPPPVDPAARQREIEQLKQFHEQETKK